MRLSALCVAQPSGRHVYAFGVLANELIKIVQVPRIGRRNGETLFGYQRPEASSHIAEIRRYLESDDAILPNAVVIAFDERVSFHPDPDSATGPVTTGF